MTIKIILTVLKRKKTQALHQASLPFGQMKLITSSTLFVSSNNIYIAASPSKEFITYKHDNACQDDLLFQGVTPPSM